MRYKIIFLLFIISVFLSINLFRGEFYISADGELHLARVAAFTKALKDGHFPVRWAKDLNYGYGYPIFNFVYPLPYLVSSFLNLAGLNIFNSLKIIFFFSFLFSGLGLYFWLEEKYDYIAGFAGALFYMASPYLLFNVYSRAALGEIFLFIFPGFVLYFFDKYTKCKSLKNLFLTSFFYALLVCTHNALALVFTAVFLLYVLLRVKKIKKDWKYFLPVVLGLFFSCFFWLPALSEAKYTMARSPVYRKDFRENFVNPVQLLFPTLLIVALVSFYKKIKDKKEFYLIFVLFLFSVFIMSPLSAFLWKGIQLLRDFQIPTRFLFLTTFCASWALALFFSALCKEIKKKIIWLVFLLALVSIFIYARPSEYLQKGEEFYLNYAKSTTWHQEATPVWVGSEADSYPEKAIESPSRVKINNVVKKHTVHEFNVQAQEKALIVDNTLYFPGWKVFVDEKKAPIEFQNPKYRGLITFWVEKGKHQVRVVFGRSKIRLFSELVSLFSFAGFLFLLAVWNKIKYRQGNEKD